jgi:hypothetical protein
MSILLWLLKALQRLIYDKVLGSSLHGIILLWNFLKRQVKKARKLGKKYEKFLKDGPVTGLGNKFYEKEGKYAQVSYRPPMEPSIIVYASRVPDSAHLYPFSSPNVSVSSQDTPSSLNPADDLPHPRTSYNSRILYPNIPGYARGSANAARVSVVHRVQASPVPRVPIVRRTNPASSGTRISIQASPFLTSVATPDTQVPIPSHASTSHLSLGASSANEDSFQVTLRRRIGASTGENRYDTTTPVQDPEGVATAGNRPIYSNRGPMLKEIYEDFFAMAPEIYYRYYQDGIVLVLGRVSELESHLTLTR